jgi:protoheme IX farnesyltransferase
MDGAPPPGDAGRMPTALVLGAVFIVMAIAVARSDSDKPAKQLFGYSILYLFILFGLMPIDRLITGAL